MRTAHRRASRYAPASAQLGTTLPALRLGAATLGQPLCPKPNKERGGGRLFATRPPGRRKWNYRADLPPPPKRAAPRGNAATHLHTHASSVRRTPQRHLVAPPPRR